MNEREAYAITDQQFLDELGVAFLIGVAVTLAGVAVVAIARGIAGWRRG